MRRLLDSFVLALSTVRLIPHLAVAALAPNRAIIRADVGRWTTILLDAESQIGFTPAFLRLMTFHPEYRNVFYYRAGLMGKLWRPLCPQLGSLHIATPKIGPGLFIQHGFATIIAAREIGRDAWINQQVTIGFNVDGQAPTLGDGVRVAPGARVIGGIHIGDNATIGANCVVAKDLPAGATVVPARGRLISLDGKKVDQPF